MLKFIKNIYDHVFSFVITVIYIRTVIDDINYLTQHVTELDDIYKGKSDETIHDFIDRWLDYMLDKKGHDNLYMEFISVYGYDKHIEHTYKLLRKEV